MTKYLFSDPYFTNPCFTNPVQSMFSKSSPVHVLQYARRFAPNFQTEIAVLVPPSWEPVRRPPARISQTDRQVVASGRKLNFRRDLRWVAKRTRKFPRSTRKEPKKKIKTDYPLFYWLIIGSWTSLNLR